MKLIIQCQGRVIPVHVGTQRVLNKEKFKINELYQKYLTIKRE